MHKIPKGWELITEGKTIEGDLFWCDNLGEWTELMNGVDIVDKIRCKTYTVIRRV